MALLSLSFCSIGFWVSMPLIFNFLGFYFLESPPNRPRYHLNLNLISPFVHSSFPPLSPYSLFLIFRFNPLSQNLKSLGFWGASYLVRFVLPYVVLLRSIHVLSLVGFVCYTCSLFGSNVHNNKIFDI